MILTNGLFCLSTALSLVYGQTLVKKKSLNSEPARVAERAEYADLDEHLEKYPSPKIDLPPPQHDPGPIYQSHDHDYDSLPPIVSPNSANYKPSSRSRLERRISEERRPWTNELSATFFARVENCIWGSEDPNGNSDLIKLGLAPSLISVGACHGQQNEGCQFSSAPSSNNIINTNNNLVQICLGEINCMTRFARDSFGESREPIRVQFHEITCLAERGRCPPAQSCAEKMLPRQGGYEFILKEKFEFNGSSGSGNIRRSVVPATR